MDKRAMADQAVAEFGNTLTVEGLRLGSEDNSCVLVFDGDLLLNIEFDDKPALVAAARGSLITAQSLCWHLVVLARADDCANRCRPGAQARVS